MLETAGEDGTENGDNAVRDGGPMLRVKKKGATRYEKSEEIGEGEVRESEDRRRERDSEASDDGDSEGESEARPEHIVNSLVGLMTQMSNLSIGWSLTLLASVWTATLMARNTMRKAATVLPHSEALILKDGHVVLG